MVVYIIPALKANEIYTPPPREAIFAPGTFLRDGGRFLDIQRGGGVYMAGFHFYTDRVSGENLDTVSYRCIGLRDHRIGRK